MAESYLYLTDETGTEIPGTRRKVDYDADPDTYFMLRDQLSNAAGEGCLVRDTALDA